MGSLVFTGLMVALGTLIVVLVRIRQMRPAKEPAYERLKKAF